jgi:outer membrane protein OmpA-like peptidoglycan-associated protein
MLGSVHFRVGSARIGRRAHRDLERLLRQLEAMPTTEIAIVVAGHADETGDEDTNVALSRARAEAVRDYLVSRGIDAEQLDTTAHGSSRPVATGTDRAAHRKNRRVEISVLGSAEADRAIN